MRIKGHTERFTQPGYIYLDEKRKTEERSFLIHVTSTAEGRTLSIADPVTSIQFTVPADLISYWLERGTDR